MMIIKLLLLGALLVVGLGATTSSAGATPQDKVTICHRTDAAKHPYVKIEVDEDAVDGEAGNSGNQADHYGEHKGPLVTSTAEAQDLKDADKKWGDIIPPVGEHQGLNYEKGQEILENGCRLVGEAPDDTVVVTIKESLDCDTKKVNVTTTTTTTTYEEEEIIVIEDDYSKVQKDAPEWVAKESVEVEESIRDATTEELATCPDDGEVLGTTVVKNLPYTGGDATLASVIAFSTIAAAIAGTSVVARRALGSKI